jgi:hypothetical protein
MTGWMPMPSPNGTNHKDFYVRFYERAPPEPVTFIKPTYWPAVVACDTVIDERKLTMSLSARQALDQIGIAADNRCQQC